MKTKPILTYKGIQVYRVTHSRHPDMLMRFIFATRPGVVDGKGKTYDVRDFVNPPTESNTDFGTSETLNAIKKAIEGGLIGNAAKGVKSVNGKRKNLGAAVKAQKTGTRLKIGDPLE